jgi:hypothetical protein
MIECFAILSRLGLVAQSVEQRIENPCVGGSIPPRATKNIAIMRQATLLGVFVSVPDIESVEQMDGCGDSMSHALQSERLDTGRGVR